MLSDPASHARPATAAAVPAGRYKASSGTGSGANQSSGQTGFSPLPNQNSSAVPAKAAGAATERRLTANAIDVPREGAVAKSTEPNGGPAHASAQVKHHQPLPEGSHLEADLPHVVLAKKSAVDAFLNDVGGKRGGGRTAGTKIAGKLPGSFALRQKHQLKKPWVPQSMIEKNIQRLSEPLSWITRHGDGGQARGQVGEAILGERVQQCGPIGVMTIDRHGRDSRRARHPAHGYCLRAFPVEQTARRPGDLHSSGTPTCGHVYSVYRPPPARLRYS